MPSLLEAESRLTDRYQTTVPASVRKALALEKRDKLRFVIQADGQVMLTRIDDDADDPVIGHFLEFLAADMSQNPERILSLDTNLAKRIDALVGDVEVDLDAPLANDE